MTQIFHLLKESLQALNQPGTVVFKLLLNSSPSHRGGTTKSPSQALQFGNLIIEWNTSSLIVKKNCNQKLRKLRSLIRYQ